MKITGTNVLTAVVGVPVYALSAAGWAMIVGISVAADLIGSRPLEEVPGVVAPLDKDRAVA